MNLSRPCIFSRVPFRGKLRKLRSWKLRNSAELWTKSTRNQPGPARATRCRAFGVSTVSWRVWSRVHERRFRFWPFWSRVLYVNVARPTFWTNNEYKVQLDEHIVSEPVNTYVDHCSSHRPVQYFQRSAFGTDVFSSTKR